MSPHLSHPKYRPDIDGLRAIAVLSVVFFHAFPGLIHGGFIGVDVFFVISGFLISTIIFESLDKGTFSFREFYARRIKRIFPALLLVLITCYSFGWIALSADEYKQLGKHIAAGAGFVSNFSLLSEAGYFDNSAESKPLLHLWSLGIEEQFYIVWPALIWVAWKYRFNLFTMCVIFSALSFFLNMKGIEKSPTITFYSPQARFWELLCGSILAWVTLYKNNAYTSAASKTGKLLTTIIYRNNRNHENTLPNLVALTGTLLLAFGFWRINKDIGFPGKWALIPTMGTVLIIAAGPKAWINRTILSNKLAVWFGLISFPLYLWHWPLLSFSRILEDGEPSKWIRLALVLASIILAWLTCWFIEHPLRSGQHTKAKVYALSLLMVLAGSAGYFTYKNNGLESRAYVKNISQQAELKFAYERNTNWICDPTIFTGTYCSFSGKAPFTVVIGDSHSPRIYSGLKNLYEKSEKGIANIGSDGCPPLIDTIGMDSRLNYDPDCQRHMSDTITRIAKDPSISDVFLTGRGPLYTEGTGFGDHEKFSWILRKKNNTNEPQSNAEVYASGLKNTLELLTNAGKNVTLLYDVPELGFYVKSCINTGPVLLPLKLRNPCAVKREDFISRNSSYKALTQSVLSNFPNVHTIDLSIPLCDELYCYGVIDGAPMYTDDDHLSARGAIYVAEKLKNSFITK